MEKDHCDQCNKPIGGIVPRPSYVFHIWCSWACTVAWEVIHRPRNN